jgi:WD40 repeat protein
MTSGAEVTAAQTGTSRAPKRNFATRVFGYDLFISFALGPPPRGTHSYASDLARRLRERDFTVFFSEDEAAPGEQLNSTLLKALYRSRTLVLIANQGTLQEPRWVRQEVEAFRSRHPDRPIIPISVGGALQDATLAEQTRQWLAFDDKIWLDESHDALAEGIASDQMVARLAMVPAGRSSNVKWRWVVGAVVAALVILSGAATWFGIYARKESTIAIAKAREAKARELAAYSTQSLSDDPEKSILLGMQAVNATLRFGQLPVPAAQEALHQALLSFRELLTLKGHNKTVTSVAWSPDGKRLATAGDDDTAKVWDVANGQELLTLRGHNESVSSVAWSPDGKRLATGSWDHTAKVWDATSGQELLTLKGHNANVVSVAWSPDGRRLASISGEDLFRSGISGDHTAKVWDVASGQEVLTLKGHKAAVVSVAWSPDGKRLATGSVDKTAKVWDATSGRQLLTLRIDTTVLDVAWSPDGKRLATMTYDHQANVWDVASGQQLLSLTGYKGIVASFSTSRDFVTSLAWSPDGKRLVTAGDDDTAKVWDVASGQELLTLKGHTGEVGSVAWSPDGRRLATGSWDDTAKVWDMASGQELLTLKGLNVVAWSPDGKRLATGSWDDTAKVWDATSGQELLLLTMRSHNSFVATVAWSPDGKRLATGSDDEDAFRIGGDQTAKVWDAASGQEFLTLKGHTGQVNSVAWSPNGRRLATAWGDHTTKVWDAASGQEVLTLKGPDAAVFSVAWSPDGKRLAIAGNDVTAKVWDAASGQELLTLKGHSHGLVSVAWSPDGKRLATGSVDKTAKVWDASSGKELLTLKGHTREVFSVAWSPDGKRLATGSADQTAKVWDAASGEQLLTLKGHTDVVSSVAWSPDGKRLATGSVDGTVQIYSMDIHDLLKLARSRVTRDLTPDECERYFQSEKCPRLP